MAYDHEEQEQLDALKAWWKQYGNLISWVLIAVLAVVGSWKMWEVYQGKQSAQASVLYEEMQKAMQDKNQTKIAGLVSEIQEKYARTDYAQMASMLAAKNAFDANDVNNLAAAKKLLTWVVENSKSVEFESLAKIRLAGILLDEKSYDAALKLLASEFPPHYASTVADRKGDIFVAQNKISDARSAYQLALKKGSDKNPDHQLIQLKLDAIGGASP